MTRRTAFYIIMGLVLLLAAFGLATGLLDETHGTRMFLAGFMAALLLATILAPTEGDDA